MEQQLTFFLALAVGLVFGGLAVWLMLRADTNSAYARARAELAAELTKLNERLGGKETRINELTTERSQLKAESDRLRQDNAALRIMQAELELRVGEHEKAAAEKLAVIEKAEEKLADAFRALSAEALQTNNQTFLHLAQATLERYQESAKSDLASRQQAIGGMVKPLRESLGKVDESIREIEKSRSAAYAGITEQVQSLVQTQNLLRAETSNLVGALRTPTVRGRWGEIQLRRVVEMSGMLAHCDFDEQPSVETEGGRLRPDMIVHLPGSRQVVVDAKVALQAYLEAQDADGEEVREAKLVEHASQVRAHLQQLGDKAYWERLEGSPEFVVAFLPGEAFFSAALEKDPGLIEFGLEHNVILSTPTTLIALLKAVAYGWRQERLAQSAQEVSALGKTLYERLNTFSRHLESVGSGLQRSVEGYNRAVGSLESRVLVSARRFHDLGAAPEGRELRPLEPVDSFPRSLQAVERAVTSGGGEVDPFDALEPEAVEEMASEEAAAMAEDELLDLADSEEAEWEPIGSAPAGGEPTASSREEAKIDFDVDEKDEITIEAVPESTPFDLAAQLLAPGAGPVDPAILEDGEAEGLSEQVTADDERIVRDEPVAAGISVPSVAVEPADDPASGQIQSDPAPEAPEKASPVNYLSFLKTM